MTARLATAIWVAALRQRLEAAAVPFYVLARGEAQSGAVALIGAGGDGRAGLWRREYDFARDARLWRCIAEGPEPEITAAARRERARDPDLWLIEVEAADLTPWLETLE